METADEGYYLKYASVITEKGLAGYSGLILEYAQNPGDWKYPSPLRLGFIVISSLWLRVVGHSFQGLSYLSLFAHGLFLVVSFFYTRKYYGKKIALLLAVLLAFSPLQMALARRALSDSMLNLTTILSLWLFFDNLEDRSKLKLFLFIISYSLTILIKETSLILSILFILHLLLCRLIHKRRVSIIDFLSVTLIPFGIVALAYISLTGGIGNIIEISKVVLISPKDNEYVRFYCAGPWFRYLIDFLLLSPWTILLSAGFVGYTLATGKADKPVGFFLLATAVFLAVLNFAPKNARYALALDMPVRLFAVLMLTTFAEKRFGKYVFTLSAVLVAVLAVTDYYRFEQFFMIKQIYDPVTFFLLKAYRIVP